MFKPTPEMQLTKDRAEISAYIFCADNDPKSVICSLSLCLFYLWHYLISVKSLMQCNSEVLVKMGKTMATRGDLISLCPGQIPKDQVITNKDFKFSHAMLQK